MSQRSAALQFVAQISRRIDRKDGPFTRFRQKTRVFAISIIEQRRRKCGGEISNQPSGTNRQLGRLGDQTFPVAIVVALCQRTVRRCELSRRRHHQHADARSGAFVRMVRRHTRTQNCEKNIHIFRRTAHCVFAAPIRSLLTKPALGKRRPRLSVVRRLLFPRYALSTFVYDQRFA